MRFCYDRGIKLLASVLLGAALVASVAPSVASAQTKPHAAQPPKQPQPPKPGKQPQPPKPGKQPTMVWAEPGGKVYHTSAMCKMNSVAARQMTLAEARQQWIKPCKVCRGIKM